MSKSFVINRVARVGKTGIDFLATVGGAGIFFVQAIATVPHPRAFRWMIPQFYRVGVASLGIMIISGAFIGMVLGVQGYTMLSRFGAEQTLGQLIALSMIRELGPVLGALLFAGRVGSALTAEIGLMKATDQLASLEMLAVDPLRRLIAPRFWAGQITLPLLTGLLNGTAILSGYWIGVEWLGIDSGAFWSLMRTAVDFYNDILGGLIKSMVFAAIVTWIALYQGYRCAPSSEGIGHATTKTVVYASLAVLGMDFFLTAILFGGIR